MIKGKVKFFIPPKGWGFITYKDERNNLIDCFVHFSDIIAEKSSYKKLYKGQSVEFTLDNSGKQFKAVKVKPLTFYEKT